MEHGAIWLAAAEGAQLLRDLFLIFFCAKLLAEIFQRLGQPAVVGEILAGVAIGPGILGWVSPSEATTALAQLGVIFLLFNVGLGIRPAEMLSVGGTAMAVAALGVVLPFAAGWTLAWAWNMPTAEAVFIAAGLVATSVGITARVLQDMGKLETRVARVILGAAVADDILALIALGMVSGLAKGQVRYAEVATTAALAIGFPVALSLVGRRAMPRILPWVRRLHLEHELLIFSLALLFGLSYLAAYIGIAAIIGAFLAGMLLSESAHGMGLEDDARSITELVVPFFLVDIGMRVVPGVFLERRTLVFVLLLTLIATLTKLAGCGLGALRLGWREAVSVGVGMIPRGEVGIIVAQIGLGMQVLSDSTYASLVAMAVLTTLMTPPVLQRLARSGWF